MEMNALFPHYISDTVDVYRRVSRVLHSNMGLLVDSRLDIDASGTALQSTLRNTDRRRLCRRHQFFLMLHYVPDYFNDGRITKIYIVRKAAARRLVVWFTREDNPAGMAGVYSQRIKSFDLDTGRLRSRLTLARRHTFDDYRIFGPCGPFAWGCMARHGIAYLDLFETKVIADEQGILKRNPVLGDRVRLVSGPYDRQFDPLTCGIYVFTAQ